MRIDWTKAAWVVGGLVTAGAVAFAVKRTLDAAGITELERGQGGENLLVDILTPMDAKTEFVRGTMSGAASADPSLSLQSRMLLAAWAAHESGWGKTKQAQLGFNYWNVSKGSWTGPTIPGGDTEYQAGSNVPVKIGQLWRQYGSPAQAVSDLLNLLRASRYVNYREAAASLAAGRSDFVVSLGLFDRDAFGTVQRVDNRANVASYYTKPRSEYVGPVQSLLTTVQGIVAANQLSGLVC